MKLTLRDLFATVVVVAIGVPYIGFLVKGEMPFIKDPRGMSAVGLVLGAVAFLLLRSSDTPERVTKIQTGASIVSMALGVVALVFAETAAADVLLAVFMVSILLVWAFELLDHAGLLPSQGHPSGLSHA